MGMMVGEITVTTEWLQDEQGRPIWTDGQGFAFGIYVVQGITNDKLIATLRAGGFMPGTCEIAHYPDGASKRIRDNIGVPNA